MQLVLQEKVVNLGNVGDVVKVKPGYGRNYLLPTGKALMATKENLAIFETIRAQLEAKEAEKLTVAQQRGEKLAEMLIDIKTLASDEGKLFGSIGPRDIAQAFCDAGEEVSKSEVALPEGPIRMTGEHEIALQLHGDVHVVVKITVSPEKA